MKANVFLGVGVLGVVATVCGTALAATSVYSGVACHNYYGTDTRDIEYYSHGVVNTNPNVGAKKVICPVTKNANDRSGLTVRVNVDSPKPNSIKCTLRSHDWNGALLGLKSINSQIKGKETLTLRVPTSTARSSFSVLCDLPSQNAAEIYSVEALN